jgi:hypothetical protein
MTPAAPLAAVAVGGDVGVDVGIRPHTRAGARPGGRVYPFYPMAGSSPPLVVALMVRYGLHHCDLL